MEQVARIQAHSLYGLRGSQDYGVFVINENIRMVGYVVLAHQQGESEIGYCLLKEYQGQGITTMAVGAACEHSFQAETTTRIVAYIPNFHGASRRVVEKNHFIAQPGEVTLERHPGRLLHLYTLDKPAKPSRATASSMRSRTLQ